MSKKRFWTNKEDVCHFVSMAVNIYLAMAVIIFVPYLVAPLLGGKLFPRALIMYGSWIGMALCSKYFLSRLRKGLPIRLHEYVLLSLYSIGCMFLWFPYPISILFSILIIIGDVFSYKAQHRRARAARS
jgi:hypothetical protein